MIGMLCGLSTARALQFTFEYGTELQALQTSNPTLYGHYTSGFQSAAAIWSQHFSDPITVNLFLDISADAGSLAFTSAQQGTVNIGGVVSHMLTDAKTEADHIAIQNLPMEGGFVFTTNESSTSQIRGPKQIDPSKTIHSTMLLSYANQKALGLRDAHDPSNDAIVRASTAYTWDFDRSDGIGLGHFDYIGAMTHEIGHAMGFLSGVDFVDEHGTVDPNQAWASPLDFFRQSPASIALPGLVPVADFGWGGPVMDHEQWSVFFSYDGGSTHLADLATGAVHTGDQASHFLFNGIGHRHLMDAHEASGAIMVFSAEDILAFDVIGYDPVPEPKSLVLLALVVAFGMMRIRKVRA